MKRAFTLVEVLAVIGVTVTLAAISYPVFAQAHRSALKSACISNLRQMGVAIALYRSEYSGAEVGTAVEMGMPPSPQWGYLIGGLRCQGSMPDGGPPGYHFEWPDPDATARTQQIWKMFVARDGQSTVMVYDPSHQPSAGLRSNTWDNWTALGLRLDTSVIVRTRRQYPYTLGWWQKP